MQDEINEKIVGLSIRMTKDAARLTEQTLKDALRQFLAEQEYASSHSRRTTRSTRSSPGARSSPGGRNNASCFDGQSMTKRGKQTIGELMEQNQGLSNIEITDGNIKSFEKTARKYNIDFALRKDKTEDPPKYLVFFKARDVDVMTAAFKEYTAKEMAEEKKPSLKKLLSNALEIAAKHKERTKEKEKDRGQSL